jgi:putative effector of murein hydrolase LrgA (UPF0299 family)
VNTPKPIGAAAGFGPPLFAWAGRVRRGAASRSGSNRQRDGPARGRGAFIVGTIARIVHAGAGCGRPIARAAARRRGHVREKCLMLQAFAVLLTFQCLGEGVSYLFGIPVPGPVIGMLLLFGFVMLRPQVADAIEPTAFELLRHLSLLFVPAGVGIMVSASACAAMRSRSSSRSR